MNIWPFYRESQRLCTALLIVGILLLFCAGCDGNSISFKNAGVTLPDVTLSETQDDSAAETVSALDTTEEATEENADAEETTNAETTSETEPFSQEKAAETTAAADGEPGTTSIADADEQAYVVNTNTCKFHYPNCASVKDIKPKNRSDRVCPRETLLSEGFVPCKRCNP